RDVVDIGVEPPLDVRPCPLDRLDALPARLLGDAPPAHGDAVGRMPCPRRPDAGWPRVVRVLFGDFAGDEVADPPSHHETGSEPHTLSLVQSEAVGRLPRLSPGELNC